MSFTKIFILVLVFAYISCICTNFTSSFDEFSEDSFTYIDPTASKNSCINRQLSPEEEGNGKIKCCYANTDCEFYNPDPKDEDDKEKLTFKNKYCYAVTQKQYDNLKDSIKKQYSYFKCKTLDIDCNSSYLGLTIIFLILNIL